MIDLADLTPHLTDAKIRTDEYGHVRVRAAGGRDLALGVAQHASDPDSILGLTVYEPGAPFREIFVCADEWQEHMADVAAAVTMPSAAIWIGSARERHAELVRELHEARELAAVAAARAWSGSELRDADDSVIVAQGNERTRAALQISPAQRHEIRLVATLGRHELFEACATVREAPSVAFYAIRALQQGERLGDSDALHAQRTAQRAFVESNGLAESYPGSIWSAARQHAAAHGGTLFEKLKVRKAPAKPEPKAEPAAAPEPKAEPAAAPEPETGVFEALLAALGSREVRP